MGRPHIEFIQAQTLAWRPSPWPGHYAEAEVKVLSRDEDTGATSNLIRYPPGWSRTEPEYLAADEELYVLSGALTINGVAYGEACYAHLPAGFARASALASGGAVVLTYLSGVPESATGAPPPGLYKEARLVTRIEVPRMNDLGTADFARLGSSEFDPTGLGARILREDPETGEVTWIMGCDDGGWTEKTEDGGSSMERHPVVEEIFVVAGAMTGNVGTLYPGAYFWRPPDIWHGPYGVRGGGFIHLNRCHGGPFGTDFKAEPVAVDFDTPYRPVLPPDLAALAGSETRAFETNY
jgi:quercetin dioxygenase-like cupin family protein